MHLCNTTPVMCSCVLRTRWATKARDFLEEPTVCMAAGKDTSECRGIEDVP